MRYQKPPLSNKTNLENKYTPKKMEDIEVPMPKIKDVLNKFVDKPKKPNKPDMNNNIIKPAPKNLGLGKVFEG